MLSLSISPKFVDGQYVNGGFCETWRTHRICFLSIYMLRRSALFSGNGRELER